MLHYFILYTLYCILYTDVSAEEVSLVPHSSAAMRQLPRAGLIALHIWRESASENE